MDELATNHPQSPEPTPAVDKPSGAEERPRRPLRSHAGKSIVRRRVRKIIDMLAMGVDDEETLLDFLQKEGISRRQAKRYVAKANRELEVAGAGVSARDWGLKIKQANLLATHAYRDAHREGGDRAIALQAHRNAVSTMSAAEKIAKSYGK